jgi:hypothetical protein
MMRLRMRLFVVLEVGCGDLEGGLGRWFRWNGEGHIWICAENELMWAGWFSIAYRKANNKKGPYRLLIDCLSIAINR